MLILKFTQHVVCVWGKRKEIHKKTKKLWTCRQGGFWENSWPSASVNARQKSSIEFATVDQVPGIIKCTTYHRVTEIAAAVDQVFLPGHFNCHTSPCCGKTLNVTCTATVHVYDILNFILYSLLWFWRIWLEYRCGLWRKFKQQTFIVTANDVKFFYIVSNGSKWWQNVHKWILLLRLRIEISFGWIRKLPILIAEMMWNLYKLLDQNRVYKN